MVDEKRGVFEEGVLQGHQHEPGNDQPEPENDQHNLYQHCKEGNDKSNPNLGSGCYLNEGQKGNVRDDGSWNFQNDHWVENTKYRSELKMVWHGFHGS